RIPAPAPELHIDAIGSEEWFLQTSPELCMKRLLAAGYQRIFQICRCFRKNERGNKHLEEFTMLEWYCANSDYMDMMNNCEALVVFAAEETGHYDSFSYQGQKIDLKKPFDRLTVAEAFEKYASIDMSTALKLDKFDECMGLEIEPCLGRQKPLFLYDYPAQCNALARLSPDNPMVAERFELYIAGIELCNAFSELTDPQEQKSRFEEEEKNRRSLGKPPYPFPKKFIQDLAYMPPASGNALGIDRLSMLFADTEAIDDIVTFTYESL
ncbi:EF-P lysine aminoacylase EpmA, partial [Desulfobacterales bacterium HSG16]|nr:EF-P lysine aminoacylase EpmA [Desulfobacterales bacterium HSG16]